MRQYIGAIDQGTTSTRFMVFNPQGQPVAAAQKEHRQIYPRPGWVEHDPTEIWQNTQQVIRQALAQANLQPGDLAAVGITNQRETIVAWDPASGQPLYNAIVWQDTRTDAICAELANAAGGPDALRPLTGLPISTYFSGPKITWLLRNVPGLAQKAQNGLALFGTIDSWLLWNLTGRHITDVTNAGRTLLMNIHTLQWDETLLGRMQVPPQALPSITSSSEVYAPGLGVLQGAPIAGNLGDQHAALFGQACYSPGEAKNTYGTGCFMMLNTGATAVQSANGLLTTLAYKIGNAPAQYALEGSIAITGALIQWLRDNLGLIGSAAQVEELAASVEDNGGMYLVPAFSGLFAPYWKSDARGVMVGLTRYITKAHVARAALEATAYQTREVLEAMEKDSGAALKALKVDGGMVFNNLLMQFQADQLGVPVIRPQVAETTALGAAYAAGLAVGQWPGGFDELRANWAQSAIWHPNMPAEQRQRLFAGWKKAVTRSFAWEE